MAPKVLIVLTSHGKDAEGMITGWYLPELAHPYEVFTKAGWGMTVVSPHGGAAPMSEIPPPERDPSSNDASSKDFLANHKDVWEKTLKLKDFVGRSGEFDALFYPGGHGPMYDLVTDQDSLQLAAEFAAAGKVVAAVCHGPATLLNVKGPDRKPLLAGREVTGFSDSEEKAVDKLDKMPFSLEQRMNEVSGGKYHSVQDWGEKVIVDGNVITGQNPASARKVAEEIVKFVKTH